MQREAVPGTPSHDWEMGQFLIANYYFHVIAATNNISNTEDAGNPTGQKVAGMGRAAQTQGHHHKIK